MMKKVRVRFAPSPTGLQHVGGIRSALFNYLFARHNNGAFIVRLEDTDRQRFMPEAEGHLYDSLRWLGIMPDESNLTGGGYGPYVQSQRLDYYNKYSLQLANSDQLYPCWCSPERLNKLRGEAQEQKRAFKYDRYCLSHAGDPTAAHVLRFKVPDEIKSVAWDDLVFGHMEFKTDDIDDFVAVKSDGFPTYHFANIVDDHLMEISHVMRAAEWLPSTPKHLLLYQALGWDAPQFMHLPQILGPDGKRKLAKRDGAKDILDYAQEGYLPAAVTNYLASLGWNEGSGSTREIYSKEELISTFTAERIQKSPAIFDPDRLMWMNGAYIRSMGLVELAKAAKTFWPAAADAYDEDYRHRVLSVVQERLKYLGELAELTGFFFSDPDPVLITAPDPAVDIRHCLEAAVAALGKTDFSAQAIEEALRQLAASLDIKPGHLFSILRMASTGKTAAPGLFETLAILGRESVLRRFGNAIRGLTS